MSTTPLPIVNTDEDTEAAATVTRGGELVGVPRLRKAGGVIGSVLAPWFRDASVGAGSVVIVNSAAEVRSGVAAAPGGALESMHRARSTPPATCHVTVIAVMADVLTPGGRYRFGAFDASDGYFYEVLTGASPQGRIVTRKAGVDTVVSPPFGAIQPLTVNTSRHAYTIRYLITVADFIQDGNLRHTVQSGAANPLPLVANPDVPVRAEAENLSAPGTNFIVTVANASISRLGHDLDAAAATNSRLAITNTSIQLAAANPLRKSLIVHNESNRLLFVKFGATASATSYTRMLSPDETWVIDGFSVWSGRVDGILSQASSTAFAVVTETTEV